MRNKAFLILIALCGLLMAATFGLWAYCSKLKSEKERLDGNQTALLEKVEFYQTESGKSAASVQALTLSKSEVEKHCADLTNTVKELDLKVKRLQAASTTATKTEVEVQTIVKNSIIYRDTSYLKVQAIRWKDPWINVDGLIMPDKKLDLRIQSVDTLFQVVHRVPKQWLFFRWGTKAIRQEVVSSNPHTQIVYSEYIELKKRKKK